MRWQLLTRLRYTLSILVLMLVLAGSGTAKGATPDLSPAQAPDGDPPAPANFMPIVRSPAYHYLPAIVRSAPLHSPWPADDAVGQSRNVYLTWEIVAARPDALTYTVLLEANDESPDEVLVEDLKRRAVDPYTFEEDTEYYWQVIAHDPAGEDLPGPVWSFHTDVFPWPPQVDAMVRVPAGEFLMGCDPENPGFDWCDRNQVPLHPVLLDAFEIDKYEVTNKEYRACVDAGRCDMPRRTTDDDLTHEYFGERRYQYHPVMYVSHKNAEQYCKWEGKRLPTEAEWEKAARGAIDTRPWPWGYEEGGCDDFPRCTWKPARVDDYTSNQTPYGAVNMSGNMFEWVKDYWEIYYYERSPYYNPVNTDRPSQYFTIRGGSYHDRWYYQRVSHRWFGHHGDPEEDDVPLYRSFRVGFRCARSAP